MAWNEPGKPGQDPWGGQPRPAKKTGTSSDPAEQLRQQLGKFLEKLGQNNGQNNDQNNGHPPHDNHDQVQGLSIGLGAIAGLAGVVWLLSGIYIIEPAERGVVTVFGSFSEQTSSGPHWNWPSPIGEVFKVNVEQIRNAEIGYRSVKNGNTDVNGESLMLTQDENIVDVKLAVQYNIRNAANYVFNSVDPDDTLKEVTESALREVVGKNKMDFVLTDGRSQVVSKLRDLAQSALDSYKVGIQITSVNLQDAQPPEQVQSAFADVVKAREDRQRLINEAEAYSNDILPKARGQSARLVEESNAYREQVVARAEGEANRFSSILAQYKQSQEITRQRLYLETVEQVLGASSKVMVSDKVSGQMLYLPLDKWAQGDTSSTVKPTQVQSLPDTNATTHPAVSVPSLRDNLRSREVR